MASKIVTFVGGILGAALAMVVITGCKSAGSEYISPRVEGRVLDSQTRQPLYRVQVTRAAPGVQESEYHLRRGAERFEGPFPASTDKTGHFVIDGEKALVMFAQVNWFSVDLSFEHSGYDRFVTNYTLFNATNMPSGEPVIRTGDILLERTQNKPKPKSP